MSVKTLLSNISQTSGDTLYLVFELSRMGSYEEFQKALAELEQILPHIIQTDSKVAQISLTESLSLPVVVDKKAAQYAARMLSRRLLKPPTPSRKSRVSLSTHEKVLDYLSSPGSEAEDKLEKFRERYLDSPTAVLQLLDQTTAATTIKKPFYQTCKDKNHCTQLAQISSFDVDRDAYNRWRQRGNQKRKTDVDDYVEVLIHMDKSQLQKLSLGVKKCMASKVHFIPVIKATRRGGNKNAPFTNAVANINTDVSLGDCSYLDTCYKWDHCRYLHYYTMLPTEEMARQEAECRTFNQKIKENELVKDFTWGESLSWNCREPLPAQWIQCNIFDIDMSIFGKFGVIIADRE